MITYEQFNIGSRWEFEGETFILIDPYARPLIRETRLIALRSEKTGIMHITGYESFRLSGFSYLGETLEPDDDA